MLGHMGAVASLKDCSERIQQFGAAGYQAAAEDFEAVAQQLSLLGFFVDALPSGETDFESFVRRMQGETLSEEDETVSFEPAAAPSVESQLAQQALETHALVEALKEAPADARLQQELKQNLQAIQKDADLVANHALGETAKAALEALQAGDVASVDVDAALSGLKPAQAEAPLPSAETLQLAQASLEEIDAELLAIFLEEANEVLASIEEQTALLAADPHNVDALTNIRRSTHTLKRGSSVIGRADARMFLETRSVSTLPGVGPAGATALERNGLKKIGDIRTVGPQRMRALYGDWGSHLFALSMADDPRKVDPNGERKSISSETTFFEDVAEIEALEDILWPLCEKVAARCRASDSPGLTLTLKLKETKFKIITRRRQLPEPTLLASRIFAAARVLLAGDADGRRSTG